MATLRSTAQEANIDPGTSPFEPGLGPERRRTSRLRVATIHAWISGPVRTPAVVRDLSVEGALLEPLLPLRQGQAVWIELYSGAELLGARRAVVVRIGGDAAGVSFE